MRYIKKIVCPNGCNTGFSTTAHVMQEWEVSSTGEYQNVLDECMEVTHEPDFNNTWTCRECDAEGKLVELPDTSAQTIPLKVTFLEGLESFYLENIGIIPEGYQLQHKLCYVHPNSYRCIETQLRKNIDRVSFEHGFCLSEAEYAQNIKICLEKIGPSVSSDVEEGYMRLADGYLTHQRFYMGIPLIESCLLGRQEALDYLESSGANEHAMDMLREELTYRMGKDLVWRYPLPEEGCTGAYVFPVQNGILWLPYQCVDGDDRERLGLDAAILLPDDDVTEVSRMLQSYAEGFAKAMRGLTSSHQ